MKKIEITLLNIKEDNIYEHSLVRQLNQKAQVCSVFHFQNNGETVPPSGNTDAK